MKSINHLRSLAFLKNAREEKKSFRAMEKKERWLSFGIYTLIIIITISLMLIIFNLALKV